MRHVFSLFSAPPPARLGALLAVRARCPFAVFCLSWSLPDRLSACWDNVAGRPGVRLVPAWSLLAACFLTACCGSLDESCRVQRGMLTLRTGRVLSDVTGVLTGGDVICLISSWKPEVWALTWVLTMGKNCWNLSAVSSHLKAGWSTYNN